MTIGHNSPTATTTTAAIWWICKWNADDATAAANDATTAATTTADDATTNDAATADDAAAATAHGAVRDGTATGIRSIRKWIHVTGRGREYM